MEEYTEEDLNDAFIDCKMGVFSYGGYGCFLTTIMITSPVYWDKEIESAETNGLSITINPDFFMSLEPEDRQCLLLHELWHIARLHAFRRDGRSPDYWNKACDIVINNDLHKKGYDIERMMGDMDARYDGMSEEYVYELVFEEHESTDNSKDLTEPAMCGRDGDSNNAAMTQALQKLIQADTAAKQNNEKGLDDLCGLEAGDGSNNSISKLINDFLHPKIKWQDLLKLYMREVSTHAKRTWSKRCRRYPDIYLPGTIRRKNRLEHLIYFLDVSGSISEDQVRRFNTEVRQIKKQFNPKLLTLVQFDTEIVREDVFTEKDKFEDITVIEGGGTSYEKVHDYIQEHKPTCAIIFTDLYCEPMEPVDYPVIWVAVDTPKKEIPFGKLVSIDS